MCFNGINEGSDTMTWSDPKELWHVFRGMLLPLCEIQRIIYSEDDDNKEE